MEAPPTKEEYVLAFGPISAVRVPHAIHDTMLKAQLHHLGDYIGEDGALKLTRRMLSAYIPNRAAGFFIGWFRRYQDDLRNCLRRGGPQVARGPEDLAGTTPGCGQDRDSGWGPPGEAGKN